MMNYFTEKEQEYMDYLDDIPTDMHGLLMYRAYPNDFEIGMNEYFAEKEAEKENNNGNK